MKALIAAVLLLSSTVFSQTTLDQCIFNYAADNPQLVADINQQCSKENINLKNVSFF